MKKFGKYFIFSLLTISSLVGCKPDTSKWYSIQFSFSAAEVDSVLMCYRFNKSGHEDFIEISDEVGINMIFERLNNFRYEGKYIQKIKGIPFCGYSFSFFMKDTYQGMKIKTLDYIYYDKTYGVAVLENGTTTRFASDYFLNLASDMWNYYYETYQPALSFDNNVN